MIVRKKYSDEFKNKVAKAIQEGANITDIAKEVGVARSIVQRWSTKAPAPTFSDEFKQKTIDEFRQSNQGVVAFSKGRGFSDASLRSWLNDPRYNRPSNPVPSPIPIYDDKLYSIIGRLVVSIVKELIRE